MNTSRRDNLPTLGLALGTLAARECRVLQRALAMRSKRQEGIHKARKSCRRLRSLLPLLPPDAPIDKLDQNLRQVAHRLAPLRDAYIAARTARVLASAHPSRFTPEIIRAFDDRTNALLGYALNEDPNWRQLRADVQHMAAAISAMPWQDIRPGQTRKTVKRARRKMKRAREKALSERTPPARHRWRRRARKLRYQLECLRKARRMAGMQQARTKRYGDQAKQLGVITDQLGWRQDFQIFLAAVEQLPDSPDMQMLRRALASKSASWSKSEPGAS
ncbi:CHAD domain-containing protein [Dyella sp.]|uniref:CHAD domain-containing protein n=1 Tax=Dyella sp. TaxID=1869338 RepID=UPI002D76B4A2|nr:CHAD domain-containing protein [Dyella sp.]HET7331989.1 CHAD domain-containing protein [Dyella sp.]